MFINISSDRLFFVDQDNRTELPFGDLEKNLPAFLYGDFSRILWVESNSNLSDSSNHTEIVLLHWPWSFTNIRIGTLALNTFTMLHGYSFNFLNINKLQRYRALYMQKKIPQMCVVYIWQKKNYWLVDLEKMNAFFIARPDFDWSKKESILSLLAEGIEVVPLERRLQEYALAQKHWQLVFDEVVVEWKDTIENACRAAWIAPSFYHYEQADVVLVTEILREKWWLQYEKLLTPNYMIDANVS